MVRGGDDGGTERRDGRRRREGWVPMIGRVMAREGELRGAAGRPGTVTSAAPQC